MPATVALESIYRIYRYVLVRFGKKWDEINGEKRKKKKERTKKRKEKKGVSGGFQGGRGGVT